MQDFIKIATVDEIPDPGKKLLEVEDRMIALFHVGGDFYCLDDVCTHDGGPLADGVLTDRQIACPRHGAKFDLCTGAALTMPATQAAVVHEVKIEDGAVHVKINDA